MYTDYPVFPLVLTRVQSARRTSARHKRPRTDSPAIHDDASEHENTRPNEHLEEDRRLTSSDLEDCPEIARVVEAMYAIEAQKRRKINEQLVERSNTVSLDCLCSSKRPQYIDRTRLRSGCTATHHYIPTSPTESHCLLHPGRPATAVHSSRICRSLRRHLHQDMITTTTTNTPCRTITGRRLPWATGRLSRSGLLLGLLPWETLVTTTCPWWTCHVPIRSGRLKT